MLTDFMSAMRHVRRRPGFLLLGAGALGIGLAAAILVFGMLNTMLLRTQPGMDASAQLVEIGRAGDGDLDSMSYPDFVDLREKSRTLASVYAYDMAPAYLDADGAPVSAFGMVVSGDYFAALGVGPELGRLIGPKDDTAPGENPVVVLSHAAFQRYVGGDPRAIGSTLRINGHAYELIGVTAREFDGHLAALSPSVYVPLSMASAMQVQGDDARHARSSTWLQLGGRLARGVTLEQARSELAAVSAGLNELRDANARKVDIGIAPLRPLPSRAQGIVMFLGVGLMIMCAAILALACSNLAGVLLAQGEARAGELAMRSALGASRARMLRQLLFESTLVALVAGAIGLLLAASGRNLLRLLPLPAPFPIDLGVDIDGSVVAFALGGSLLVALAFGLWPAVRVSAANPVRALGSRSEPARGASGNRAAMLTLQSAITIALLLIAAFTLLALHKADDIDTGFRTDGVYTASIDMTPLGLRGEEAATRAERLTERLRNTPGMNAASYASVMPLTLEAMGFGAVRPLGADGEAFGLDLNTVGMDFFRVFDLPVRGRAFGAGDTASSDKVAVINDTLARQLYGDADPLGQTFEIGGDGDWERIRVVGVVPTGRYSSMTDKDQPFAFMPAAQWSRARYHLFVHGDIDAATLRAVLAQELREVLPDMPVPTVAPFADMAAFSVLPQKILGSAAAALGVLALLLAATGLYGVIAYQVERRFREFGVRKAMGASGMQVAHALLRRTARWLLLGTVLGIALAELVVAGMRDLLFGISGANPFALGGALFVFAAIAALAVTVPLRRVLSLKPIEALRYE